MKQPYMNVGDERIRVQGEWVEPGETFMALDMDDREIMELRTAGTLRAVLPPTPSEPSAAFSWDDVDEVPAG